MVVEEEFKQVVVLLQVELVVVDLVVKETLQMELPARYQPVAVVVVVENGVLAVMVDQVSL